MTLIQSTKKLIALEFKEKLNKNNRQCANEVGNALTALEIEIQKKLSLLAKGSTIYDIYPNLKDEGVE